MDEFLTIGQFAKASGLSLRALRLYDEQGLLPPARVDEATGYRFYDGEQLRPAEVIRTARMLNMPLAEIRELLVDDPPEAHRRLDRFWDSFAEQVRTARTALGLLHQAIDQHLRSERTSMSAFERGNQLYFSERNVEEALARYLEVDETDPWYATAQRFIGHNIYGREWNRWPEALPFLEEALRVAPDDPKVLEDIGRAYVAVGRTEEGKALLVKAATPVADRALRKLAASE